MSRTQRKNIFIILVALVAAIGGWLARDLEIGPDRLRLPSLGGGLSVVSVADGDTVTLSDKRKVRYIGVNTPEIVHGSKPGERFGPEAKKGNHALVNKRRVRLETDVEETDRYGRTLAYVYLEDGSMVNEKLVEEGLAYCYPYGKNLAHKDVFLAAQRRAMNGRRGMWRNFSEPQGEEYYVGNPRSFRFHRPEHYPLKDRRVRFDSMRDAYYEGYAPCNECVRGE